jgi:hypothetical protein
MRVVIFYIDQDKSNTSSKVNRFVTSISCDHGTYEETNSFMLYFLSALAEDLLLHPKQRGVVFVL